MKATRRASLSLVALAAATLPATAITIHVPGEEPTIQAGIDAASAGDTVLVACDTYHEHDIAMKSNVILMSETGDPSCVTIDAQQLGRVLSGSSCESGTRIEGFTMTGGVPIGSHHEGRGGGMYWSLSTVTIANCVFTGNEAVVSGGAIELRPVCSVTLEGCTFIGNSAANGGAVHTTSAVVWLSGCIFDGNSASSGQGALGLEAESTASVTSCLFTGNSAEANAGAIRISNGGVLSVDGCTFSGNSASDGGAIGSTESSVTVHGCTFWSNTATNNGGALFLSLDSSCSLSGCTFSSNAASARGAALCPYDSSADLTNCILAFSTEGGAVLCGGTTSVVTLACCDVYGNEGGDWSDCIEGQDLVNDNFSADPLFCGAPIGDFTIDAVSPCSGESNPACGLVGAWGVGCEDPVESISWGAAKAMFR